MERIYTFRKIFPETYIIEAAAPSGYIYVLVGEESALVIDTGCSTYNLKDFINEKITRKPLMVVNTHGHFDHTGRNGDFDKIFAHPKSIEIAKDIFGSLDKRNFNLNYEMKPVTEGYIFDLGNRHVEVIEIPCHAKGSIALLDIERKLLYCGDELESGQVLIFWGDEIEGCTVENHQKMMKKLKSRINEFDYLCPAHNGSPISTDYIDYFIENSQNIMDGFEGSKKLSSPTFLNESQAEFKKMLGEKEAFMRRSEFKGSYLIYNTKYIFNK